MNWTKAGRQPKFSDPQKALKYLMTEVKAFNNGGYEFKNNTPADIKNFFQIAQGSSGRVPDDASFYVEGKRGVMFFSAESILNIANKWDAAGEPVYHGCLRSMEK